MIEQTMERYNRKDVEQNKEPLDQQARDQIETSANLLTERVEPVVDTEKATIEETPDIDLNAQAEPELVQDQAANEITLAENPLELNSILQSDEVVRDLELLLLELEGNPLEVRPETDGKTEVGAEQ
jgi:hypothetical protein